MIVSLSFLVLVAFACATPMFPSVSRQYDPEEEREDRKDFMIMPDEKGILHYVDLTAKADVRAVAGDVTFYLYTRTNPTTPFVIPASNPAAVAASPFSRTRKNLFIAHGWNGNLQSAVNTVVTPAALEVEDVNVFVVDWSGPASLGYISARSAVTGVGRIQGDFINYLIRSYSLSPSDFKLSGHSLGAHVAGIAGKNVNGQVSAIVGLDPAGPLYTVSNRANRIDADDGEFVQIIHTNGGLLGFGSSIGDADFFPNGGSSQPGCGLDLFGGCAHSRAYEYYAESIRSSGFLSLNCDSFSSFTSGRCTTNSRSTLGELVIDKRNAGDFFLRTNGNAPFALGNI